MRSLERVYSKSERIVVRARFSALVFVKELFLAAVLGTAIALLWVYAADIERALNKSFDGTLQWLTPQNLRWALLAAGCLVVLCALCEAVKMYRREIIVTEDKFIFKQGVFNITSVMLPLAEIRYIDVHQNLLQIALGYGKIRVITDGETPFVIKGLVRPEKFARKVMKQSGVMRGQASRPQFSLAAKTR